MPLRVYLKSMILLHSGRDWWQSSKGGIGLSVTLLWDPPLKSTRMVRILTIDKKEGEIYREGNRKWRWCQNKNKNNSRSLSWLREITFEYCLPGRAETLLWVVLILLLDGMVRFSLYPQRLFQHLFKLKLDVILISLTSAWSRPQYETLG